VRHAESQETASCLYFVYLAQRNYVCGSVDFEVLNRFVFFHFLCVSNYFVSVEPERVSGFSSYTCQVLNQVILAIMGFCQLCFVEWKSYCALFKCVQFAIL